MQSYFTALTTSNGALGLLDDATVVDGGDRPLDISSHLSQIGLQNPSPVSNPHEIFTEEEDLFLCGRCKQQFTDLQIFLHHKREECVPRPQNLQCLPQSMPVVHVQPQTTALHQQHGRVATLPGPRVLYSQNQGMVTQSHEAGRSVMIPTTQCSTHGVENSAGLNLTQGQAKGHDLTVPSARGTIPSIHTMTCVEPPPQHIAISQMNTMLQGNHYQNSGGAVIQGTGGNGAGNVISDEMLLNSTDPQVEFEQGSHLARLQQNDGSTQFSTLNVALPVDGGMSSFLQQIPPLQSHIPQTLPELHDNQQVVIQMSQQPAIHTQQSGGMHQKDGNNGNYGLNFSSVSLTPFTVPPSNTSFVVQYEQPQVPNTAQNLSKLPAIAPRPEGPMLVDQTAGVNPECPETQSVIQEQTEGTAVAGPKQQANPKKKCVCQYCSKAFSRGFDLEQHIRSHTGEKPFQCIVCGRAFAQKSNVKKHMSTHKVWPKHALENLPNIVIVEEPSKEKDDDGDEAAQTSSAESSSASSPSKATKTSAAYKNALAVMSTSIHTCPYCLKVLGSYKEKKTHMLKHKDKQVYKCVLETCDQTFPDLDTYVEHVKMHEGDMTYRCHHCHSVFRTLHDLGVHQYQAHLNAKSKAGKYPRLYSCSLCPGKFSHPELLRKHMASETHDHPCTMCDKRFSCERYLRKHLALVHSDNAKNNVKCDICQVTLKSVYYLRYHMLIHTKETPFKCNQCKSEFNRKDKLKRHMLVHDPVKKFKCPLRDVLGCDKEFSRPDKLKAHIIRHGGVKNHQCSYCPKAYSRRCFKIAHERTHTDEFRCTRCKKGFESAVRLSSHKCKPPAPDEPGTSSGKSRRLRGPAKRQRVANKKKTPDVSKRLADTAAGNAAAPKPTAPSAVIPLPDGPMYAIRSGSKRLRNKARMNFRKSVAAKRRKELNRAQLAAAARTAKVRKVSPGAGKISVEIELHGNAIPAEVTGHSCDEDTDVDVETEDVSTTNALKTMAANADVE